MAGNWTRLTVSAPTAALEGVSAIMSMLDSGLMIEDYSDFSLNGMYSELVDESILEADTSRVKVSVFVPEEKNLFEYKAFLEERLGTLGIEYDISCEGILEESWADSWKKYYKPVPLGRVTIVPAWETYEAQKDEVIIKMDPGMAFGTGTHETTRLVIRLMQDEELSGKRFLDIGTGSGILSVAASKLGAKSCAAYDIDPVAVRVARENAVFNGCSNITAEESDLLKDVDTGGGKYDFCVANIVSDIIIRMMPELSGYITKDAPVILSGIIAPRADEVRECVKACGYRIERELYENDWVSLLLHYNNEENR